MANRIRKIIIISAISVVSFILIILIAAFSILKLSMPRLDGERTLEGLHSAAAVARDSLGAADIEAANRLDAARALGYIHAQDRFFQMDLQRRRAAGEIAELIGPAAAGMDRSSRLHRFRELSKKIVKRLPESRLKILAAYSEGVNSGLNDLGARPFEYIILRKKPKPWLPEDTVLTIYAMFLDLSLSNAATEYYLSLAADILPAPLADYLLNQAAKWDAPLAGPAPPSAPMPDSTMIDLRRSEMNAGMAGSPGSVAPVSRSGSNNWAVAGALTSHGGAIVANDMHLSHGIPNIWYRARMRWRDAGGKREIVGVTLPGTPAFITGSNGNIAWGFTNSYADVADLVRLEVNPADTSLYRTENGWERFKYIDETIDIAGSEPETLRICHTVYGPVRYRDSNGNPLALRWSAYDTAAVNMEIIGLETAGDIDEAVAAASSSGIPPQNFVCADRSGGIAWAIAGRLPDRFGWNGRIPTSWADGSCGWNGYLAPESQPSIVNPPEGIIWTANNRVAGGRILEILGDGGYGLGARATQIRDALRAMQNPDEEDMLALQLDDRAVFMDQWRELALSYVRGDTAASRVEFARILKEDWSGRASVESAGYRLTRTFTNLLINNVYRGLTAPILKKVPDFKGYYLPNRHSIAWQLVHARPAHLLPPPCSSWDEPVLAAVDGAMKLATDRGNPASEWSWGRRNVVDISHPFARIVPILRPYLSAPRDALPGDSHMPRVQGVSFGASERMVVSPGRERSAIFHMPGGQSGHPLSDFFLAGHRNWTGGKSSALLPGTAAHRLILIPEDQ